MTAENPTPRNLTIPAPLITAINNKKCVLFLGGGFSRFAGIEDQPTFVNALLTFAIDSVPNFIGESNIIDRINREEYDSAIEAIIRQLNPFETSEFMNNWFGDTNTQIPTHLASLLKQIPFRSIVTTNLDGLLETIYPPPNRTHECRDVVEAIRDLEKGIFHLFKAHGTYSKSYLLTKSNNKDFKPDYGQYIRKAYQDYTILFLGYDFSPLDERFNLLLDSVSDLFSGQPGQHPTGVKTHYAYFSGEQIDQESVRQFFTPRNIRVIPSTEPSIDLERFLEELLGRVAPTTQPLKEPKAESPPRIFETQERVLEAAMARCIRVNDTQPTPLYIKISLPYREEEKARKGLRASLPELLPTGEIIAKEDVRDERFKIAFEREPNTQQLLSNRMRIRVSTNHFYLREKLDTGQEHEWQDKQLELEAELDANNDLPKLTLELLPKNRLVGVRDVDINVYEYEGQRRLASITIQTRLVENVEAQSCLYVLTGVLAYQPEVIRQKVTQQGEAEPPPQVDAEQVTEIPQVDIRTPPRPYRSTLDWAKLMAQSGAIAVGIATIIGTLVTILNYSSDQGRIQVENLERTAIAATQVAIIATSTNQAVENIETATQAAVNTAIAQATSSAEAAAIAEATADAATAQAVLNAEATAAAATTTTQAILDQQATTSAITDTAQAMLDQQATITSIAGTANSEGTAQANRDATATANAMNATRTTEAAQANSSATAQAALTLTAQAQETLTAQAYAAATVQAATVTAQANADATATIAILSATPTYLPTVDYAGATPIPAGTYKTPPENHGESAGEVTISSDFLLDPEEVSVNAFQAYFASAQVEISDLERQTLNASIAAANAAGAGNKPIVGVPYAVALDYCHQRGEGFTLPTEAQWEVVAAGAVPLGGARAVYAYLWGAPTPVPTWVAARGITDTSPAAVYNSLQETNDQAYQREIEMFATQEPPRGTPLFYYHLVGNAAEWVLNESDSPPYYTKGGSVASNPNDENGPEELRLAESAVPGSDLNTVGFRCVRNLSER
jgi:hypothetical protein